MPEVQVVDDAVEQQDPVMDQEFEDAFAERARALSGEDAAVDHNEEEDPPEAATLPPDQGDDPVAAAQAAPEPPAKEPEPVDLQEELKKRDEEIERLKQSDRSQRGRVSALTKKLIDMQQSAKEQPAQKQEADDSDDEWKEFEQEFPEMAKVVNKRIATVLQKVNTVASRVDQVADTQVTMVEDKIDSYRQAQFDLLRERHSDFEEIKRSPAFAEWLANAPPSIKMGVQSQHADDAAAVLDVFKAQTGWGSKKQTQAASNDIEKIKAQREYNLRQSTGIQSRQVGRPVKAPSPEDDDFASAFDAAARKKEKQRSIRY